MAQNALKALGDDAGDGEYTRKKEVGAAFATKMKNMERSDSPAVGTTSSALNLVSDPRSRPDAGAFAQETRALTAAISRDS